MDLDLDEDFASLVKRAEVGVVSVDGFARIRFANACLARMLGRASEEDLVGMSFFEIVDEAERPSVMEKFRTRKPESTESYFLSLKRSDGSVFVGRLSPVAMAGSGPGPSGTIGFITDMTREVGLFGRLWESETRFRNLARQLPAAVFEVDAEYRIHYCNDFAMKLLGLESLGREPSLRNYVAEDERSRFERIFAEAFGNKHRGSFPLDIIGPGGARLPALWSVALEPRRGGEERVSVVVLEIGSILASLIERSESLFASFGLTDRETEVAKLLVDGAIYKEIAAKLGLSLSTVRTYTMGLYRKMGIHSREELKGLVHTCQQGRYGNSGILSKFIACASLEEIPQKS